jgi:arylsulfatase A-like enzyme
MERVRAAMRSLSWRRCAPPRGGWLRLLAAPTSYLCVLALAVTVWAKGRILSDIDAVSLWPLALVWAVAIDVAVYLGFAAMFAVGEARVPWVRLATYPLTALIAALALTNAWYLSVTGETLSWEAVSLGIDRFGDLSDIVGEAVASHPLRAVAVGALLAGAPVALRWWLRRACGPWQPALHARERAACAGSLAAIGLVVALIGPAPTAMPARALGSNAALRTYWGWLTAPDPTGVEPDGWFIGYAPRRIVADEEIARFAGAASRPNILLLVLESTRFDHTSLAPPPLARGTRTPNLAALAATGTSASRARAVLPHTTKSLFSMLCGRYPTMQMAIVEHSANVQVQCLPAILSAAGYDTGFFQSAWGTFESRPRLVDKLGYEQFAAWEDIGGEPLGYLASDDESLAGPFDAWLAARPAGTPFFATLLTSATHHPYRLPAAAAERARATGAPTGTDEQRYARLVEAEDVLLGRLLESLDRRGLRESTIIVVAGDHGEGFGDKGVRQHDNNFFEEGLRVPLVLAGPGVPRQEIAANVTLADLTPTLLGRLGIAVAPDAAPALVGVDLLAGPVPDRPVLFSCWYELRCRGFVLGDDKVVYSLHSETAWAYDLARDPGETEARLVPQRLRELIPPMNGILDAHRTRVWPIEPGEIRPYGPWRCPAGENCTHPNMRERTWDPAWSQPEPPAPGTASSAAPGAAVRAPSAAGATPQ